VLPRSERTLRAAAVLYALGATVAFVLPTPVGGNAARLGALFGGPLLACALYGARRRSLWLLAAPLLFWQWSAAVRDVASAAGDPAVQAAYYAPLLRFLEGGLDRPGRVEIPLTHNRWEAAFVAPRFPLARGWERQLDTGRNGLFYDGRLNARRYEAWLREQGVRFVALSDAELDYSATQEQRLVESGLPYLREAWHGAHWRVFAVRAPGALARGAGTLTALGSDSFALRARASGELVVRVRFTPYWRIERGRGCVEPAPGGETLVRARGPGELSVVTSFAPRRVLDHRPRCRR